MEDSERQKEVEFYSQSVSAWYQSALELDKSLLYLSSGAIVLVTSLYKDLHDNITSESDIIIIKYNFLLALISYLVTVIFTLYSFNVNRSIVVNIINKNNNNNKYAWVDRVISTSFALGVVFTIISVIIMGIN